MSAFEQWLLASAQDDAQPRDTQAAWIRLAGRLSAVAETLPDPAAASPPAPHPQAAPAFAARPAWGLTVKRLLIGIGIGSMGGGALTAGIMTARLRTERESAVERSVDGHRAPPRAPVETPKPPQAAGAGDERTAATKRRRHGTPARGPDKREETAHGPDARAETSSSTLAAEVSRLDAARAAIAGGDYDGALQLVAGYHEAFPHGALSTDAEVVTLEALSGKRDQTEVERRARGFLLNHPNDPHTARVRWLAAQPSGK